MRRDSLQQLVHLAHALQGLSSFIIIIWNVVVVFWCWRRLLLLRVASITPDNHRDVAQPQGVERASHELRASFCRV